MPSYTTNYSIPKPTNNGDATTWGTYLNSGMDIIDTTVKSVSTVANAALPLAGGTLTGGLTGTSASFSSTLSVTGVVSYAARQTATILASTVAGDYLQLLPTDLGVGKAGFYIAKSATPGTWNFNFYDGATNSGTLQVNSVAAGFSGNVSVSGTLGVTGATTLTGALSPNGGIVMLANMTGGATSGAYTLAGGNTFQNGGSIQLYGSAASGAPGTIQFAGGTGGTNTSFGSFNASGLFNVVNNATIGGTLGVTGAATFSSSVSAASAAGSMLAVASDVDTGSSTSKVTTPAAVAGSAGHAKAWVKFTGQGSNGACTINKSFNVASVSRIGTGSYTITFTNALADGNYCINVTTQGFAGNFNVGMLETGNTPSTTTFTVGFSAVTNARTDPPVAFVSVFD
jgi:hypothetical protein